MWLFKFDPLNPSIYRGACSPISLYMYTPGFQVSNLKRAAFAQFQVNECGSFEYKWSHLLMWFISNLPPETQMNK